MRENYKKSKLYVDVYQFAKTGQWKASMKILGRTVVTFHDDERSAARWIDIQRIKQGLDPINILKKKSK